MQFYGPMVTEDGAAITGMFLLAWAIFSAYMLIADALVALCASAAIIVNTTWERTVLPVP